MKSFGNARERVTVALLSILCSTPALVGCGQRDPAADVDPALGRACFEAQQPVLPPGSQYEGIAGASADRVTIRAMTGAKVERFECTMGPDGIRPAAGR